MAAIATKKRLYTKALDSLTSTSQISLTSTNSSQHAKRPATAVEAFDEARERAKKRLRHSTSSGSLLPIVVPSPASTPRKDADGNKLPPPNYAPWSHDAFLKRLKTFSSVSLWHPKPESINEVEWARRGWICTDVNTVRCKGGCEKRVVVSLHSALQQASKNQDVGDDDDDDDDGAAFEQALADRYKNVIVEGHAENCLWRKGGCKDDIYHLQVVRPIVWQPELRKRVESLLEIENAIKEVKTSVPDTPAEGISSAERLLKDLPSPILGDIIQQRDPATATKALEIALHGWRGAKESGSDLLHCDACFQRIGLWMYQPDYRPAYAPVEDDGDESAEDASTLNLALLHREHCPWRNPATQKSSGSLADLNAAQILQRVVSTFARDHRRRSDEQAGVQNGEADADGEADVPEYSKEEIARQDKERESRLRRLKSLFNIKRRSTKVAPKT